MSGKINEIVSAFESLNRQPLLINVGNFPIGPLCKLLRLVVLASLSKSMISLLQFSALMFMTNLRYKYFYETGAVTKFKLFENIAFKIGDYKCIAMKHQ